MIILVFKRYTCIFLTYIEVMHFNIYDFFRLSTYVNQAEPKTAFCVQMELFSVKKNSPANGGTK